MAEFMRQAIEEKARGARPRPRAIGVARSGYRDTAARAGDWPFEPASWRTEADEDDRTREQRASSLRRVAEPSPPEYGDEERHGEPS